ncbi:hypothetical protein OH76DRAFT_1553326 [Lentinus brumalis]|uniref:Uncharacterized protein n=1 Tax=Lentinus brumalis TaxID=2498619 RepID=A0A371DMW5_9APHY|nr:hypothetical protein OH76DRAFT_1553326 [Polyporus brumalis]
MGVGADGQQPNYILAQLDEGSRPAGRYFNSKVRTHVHVYGTIVVPTVIGALVQSTYTLDNDGTTPFSSAFAASALIQEVDDQLFFDSGTLPDGDHVLVVNVTTTASGGAPYLLGYIKYTATTPTKTTSSSTSATATGSASATAVPRPIRYFRQRRKLANHSRMSIDLVEELVDEPKSELSQSAPSPFPSDLSASRSGAPSISYAASIVQSYRKYSASQVAGRLYAAELARQRAGAGPGSSAGSPYGGSSSREGESPGSGGPAWQSDRKESVPPPVPEEPEPEAVQHEDSGIRFRDGDPVSVRVEDLVNRPPDYDAPS